MLETIRYLLATDDRGVSPATSLAILLLVLVTLALSVALFVFAGP